MTVRNRRLPPGWYPRDADEILLLFDQWGKRAGDSRRDGIAGMVPHAGWAFSGELAFDVVRRLARDAETVVVVGGHLPEGGGIRAAFEEAYETPFGIREADGELLAYLRRKIDLEEDTRDDNTVEVQLPIVAALFPSVRLLALRAAPDMGAVELGAKLAQAQRETGRSIRVIGSTDLTHYGPNYDFTPKGTGAEAETWVRNVNDRDFLDAVIATDAERALRSARENRSACSAGAAAAAVAFACSQGGCTADLVGYATSLDRHRSDSFVGYGGVLFTPAAA